MDFELRKDAKIWFKDITNNYPLDFDLYYLCLMAGFAAERRNTEITSSEVTETVAYFPKEFSARGRLLVGLLIHTELSRLGIDLSERNAVYRRVAELVDPNSQSYLSKEGMRLMNQYAHGGFDVLFESFGDRPRYIETFVRTYALCLKQLKKR